MKTYKKKRFAFVEADTAADFEMRLNEALDYLEDGDPEVVFSQVSDMFARIEYSERAERKDLLPEEVGIRFTCGDCPMMKQITKRDGTPDLRRVYGDCDFGEMGRVWKTTPACGHLYKMIKEGRIHLALNEEEGEA